MHRFKGLILALSCAALLLLQMVGLHLHSSPAASGPMLHAEHVHGADWDGHDHSAHLDVPVVEYGIIWAKLAPLQLYFLLFFLPFVLISWIGPDRAPRSTACRPPAGWRPPLRAPPNAIRP